MLNISKTTKYFCCGMWGDKFVWMDWTGKYGAGPDVLLYDLSTNKELDITAAPYGQWFPTIYLNNVMYLDQSDSKGVEDAPGHIWIFDLDTQIRRRVTNIMGNYSPKIFAHEMIVRANAATLTSKIYLFDLEANGIINNGHVVQEPGNSSKDGGGP